MRRIRRGGDRRQLNTNTRSSIYEEPLLPRAARLPDCPGLREGSHAQLRGGYDGRPPMSALAQHAGTGWPRPSGPRPRGWRLASTPRLRRAERVPDGAVAISLGLDRTSVPMEEDVPAGETPATRRKTRHTPYTRTKPAPVNVTYRMAYVGTISFHDADGTALATRRYTAAAHESPTAPSRATDDGRSSPCAPAGARPGRRGHPGRRASCALGFSWTLDCERVLAGGVSR